MFLHQAKDSVRQGRGFPGLIAAEYPPLLPGIRPEARLASRHGLEEIVWPNQLQAFLFGTQFGQFSDKLLA